MIKKPTRMGAFLGAAPLLAGLACGAASQANAQEMEMEESSPVSGSLALAYNTHFISYGADVWGAGTDWDDPIFNPSIELGFDLGNGFSAVLGTWWDVNNNSSGAGESPIGSNQIQEVDVWAGVGYATGDWSFSLVYQEWLYAGQSERIVDFSVGYAYSIGEIALDPSLTIHSRIDGGDVLNLEEGFVAVLGIAPGTQAGPVSLSFPLAVAFNTDDYHGGDSGFTFASAGVSASYPLEFLKMGDWSLDVGLTGYLTSEDTTPGNPDEAFVTGSAGVSLAF